MKNLFYVLAIVTSVFAFGVSNAQAVVLDLSDETDPTIYSIAGNTGLFGRYVEGGTGTGTFDVFLRVQGKNNDTDDDPDTEQGYNTDGVTEFETKVDPHTHSVTLSEIPLVNIDGTDYREFAMDIGENDDMVLDVIEIYMLGAGNITGFAANIAPTGAEYVLDTPDNSIYLDNANGQGTADMLFYVPASALNVAGNPYVYLYVAMTDTQGAFEEFGARIGVLCEENCDPVVPEPTSMILFGTGLVGAVLRKRFTA